MTGFVVFLVCTRDGRLPFICLLLPTRSSEYRFPSFCIRLRRSVSRCDSFQFHGGKCLTVVGLHAYSDWLPMIGRTDDRCVCEFSLVVSSGRERIWSPWRVCWVPGESIYFLNNKIRSFRPPTKQRSIRFRFTSHILQCHDPWWPHRGFLILGLEEVLYYTFVNIHSFILYVT